MASNTSVIEFANHPLTVIVILILLVAALWAFVVSVRRRRKPLAVEHYVSVIKFTESPSHKTDPLTFWREEIRSIANKYGSPVKAAIHIERSMNALDFKALDNGTLESLYKYWLEISNWCGRVRIELHKLDPEQRWSTNAWTRLFNVFGKVNLLVKIERDARSK